MLEERRVLDFANSVPRPEALEFQFQALYNAFCPRRTGYEGGEWAVLDWGLAGLSGLVPRRTRRRRREGEGEEVGGGGRAREQEAEGGASFCRSSP